MWLYNSLVFFVLTLHGSNASEKIIGKIIEDDNIKTASFIDDESLIECIVELTNLTISFTPTILILEHKRDSYDDILFNKIIQTLAKRHVAIAVQDKHNYAVNQKLDIYDGIVIVTVHFENVDEFLYFNMGNVDKRVKYLVVVSGLAEDYIINFQRYGQKFIEHDVTFIIQGLTAEKYDVITFLPTMNGETCQYVDIIKPTQINFCRNGSLQNDVVFPVENKVDLENCSLKVGMGTMFPFSQIPDEGKLKNYDMIHDIKGSDVEIIKIIANYFNASIAWHYLRRDHQNPFSDKEYVDFIANGSVDACAGGFYRIYGDLVSYSGIYTRRAVIWVYAAHRNSRSWVNLVQKLHGMYLFYLIYLCYSISSYVFRKYDHKKLPFTDILLFSWGSLIGGSSLPEPKSLKHRILNLFYLLLCIYLSVYMSIQLVSFLTVDGPSISFKTNDDVVNSGRTPYLNPINKNFVQESKYLAFANTSKNCGDFYDCIYKIIDTDGLTVMLDQYFYPLQASTAVKAEAKLLRATQNIIIIYQEMLIRKNSLIVVGFQRVLNSLFEAGICDHLFKEAIGITVVARADSANKNAVSNSYSCETGCAITMSQVAGVFYVWAIGCIFSVSVLFYEILWKRETSWFIKD